MTHQDYRTPLLGVGVYALISGLTKCLAVAAGDVAALGHGDGGLSVSLVFIAWSSYIISIALLAWIGLHEYRSGGRISRVVIYSILVALSVLLDYWTIRVMYR